MPQLFLAKNDARLGQVVGRKLDLDFIAGNDADEMFAHLARDMREDIALAWKIDTKHGARQHLRDNAFRDDLFFFRHRAKYTREQPASQPSRAMSILLNVAQRNRRQILAKLAPFPPCARLLMFGRSCETVIVKRRANVTRRRLWKWIVREESLDVRASL